MTDLRTTALSLFQAAVDRADPARALRQQLAATPAAQPDPGGRSILIAIGKAAIPMMQEALTLIPEPRSALVVTNPENRRDLPGATVLAGSHPVPDSHSAEAGRAVIDLLAGATAADRVIALISGGGSALAVAPAPGLSLEDKAKVNSLLLGSGLEINDMNLVRQQLSDLKGGGLLRHAAPAPVQAFILSDVIGDDLRAIASGPTVSAIGTRAAAVDTLISAGIWDACPDPVRALLSAPNETQADLPAADNHLIGSNRHSLDAMLQLAQSSGWQATIVSDHLTGDVGQAAETILAAAKATTTEAPVALIFGGETTVQITGTGRGGRNQELALRVAQMGATRLSGNWLFLSGGTDGRDGPTEAAGGLVGPDSWAAISRAGLDPDALLSNNDSNAALAAADALLTIGGTGTNVADVQVFLRMP